MSAVKRLAITHLVVPNGQLPDDLVLLGTWCLSDRIDLSEKDFKSATVRHPWLDDKCFESDFAKIRELYDHALASLMDQLNMHHQINLSLRAWEIALGPWLRMFMNCVYERHLLLEEAVRSFDITSVLAIEHIFERTPDTTRQFVQGALDPKWNAIFLQDIVACMFPEMEHEILPFLDSTTTREISVGQSPLTLMDRLANRIKTFFICMDELISRHRRVLIHRTGMQWRDEFKLMLRLGLIPHMFLPKLDASLVPPTNDGMRQTLSLGLGQSSVEQVMNQMFRPYLPRIFVEDFAAVKELIERRYPKRAKLIITGVAYASDDYFKLYTAFATDAGAHYAILQHGGGFGTMKINDEEDLQLKTCDDFLTWGWVELDARRSAKTIPSSSFWLSTLGEVLPDPGGVLLMPVSEWSLQTFRLFSAPLSFRQLEYLADIISFYRLLDPPVAEHFRLRLSGNRGWRVADRFEVEGMGHAILRSPGRFVTDLKGARLAVVNTNSTTLLEVLSLNFPTVAILDPQMSPVKDNVHEAFDDLERVGIAYRTPEAAAEFISSIFADPTSWWINPELQRVRRSFVDRFARRDPEYIEKLSKYLSQSDHKAQICK